MIKNSHFTYYITSSVFFQTFFIIFYKSERNIFIKHLYDKNNLHSSKIFALLEKMTVIRHKKTEYIYIIPLFFLEKYGIIKGIMI